MRETEQKFRGENALRASHREHSAQSRTFRRRRRGCAPCRSGREPGRQELTTEKGPPRTGPWERAAGTDETSRWQVGRRHTLWGESRELELRHPGRLTQVTRGANYERKTAPDTAQNEGRHRSESNSGSDANSPKTSETSPSRGSLCDGQTLLLALSRTHWRGMLSRKSVPHFLGSRFNWDSGDR